MPGWNTNKHSEEADGPTGSPPERLKSPAHARLGADNATSRPAELVNTISGSNETSTRLKLTLKPQIPSHQIYRLRLGLRRLPCLPPLAPSRRLRSLNSPSITNCAPSHTRASQAPSLCPALIGPVFKQRLENHRLSLHRSRSGRWGWTSEGRGEVCGGGDGGTNRGRERETSTCILGPVCSLIKRKKEKKKAHTNALSGGGGRCRTQADSLCDSPTSLSGIMEPAGGGFKVKPVFFGQRTNIHQSSAAGNLCGMEEP